MAQATQSWTIKRLLEWITGFFEEKALESPRLCAELLVAHVLEMKRIELYMHFDRAVDQDRLAALRELVKRAAEQEPLSYLIGHKEFYSLEIKVTPDTLIPRPETELLAERAIDFLRDRGGHAHVLDLCTGSGCVAIAVAKNYADADIIATDVSDAALQVAAENVQNHGVENRVKLLCGDLFDPIIDELYNAAFDLIVCNPPYVSTSEYQALDPNVKNYEPEHALHAGQDGLDVYRRIAAKVHDFLQPRGLLALEIGYAQGQLVRELLEQTGGFSQIDIQKDFSNNDRIVLANRAE